MLRNYFTTALRVLVRQKAYSFINVFGLALGIAATLLIALYVYDEWSYDRFHKDADRMYRLVYQGTVNGKEFSDARGALQEYKALQYEFPQIESVIKFHKPLVESGVFYEDRQFTEKDVIYADSNFFEFFTLPLLKGNPNEVLDGPNQAVISQDAALKYFGIGAENLGEAIGKTLLLGTSRELVEITGIARNCPSHSHFHFDIVASVSTNKNLGVVPSYIYFKTHGPGEGVVVEENNSYLQEKYLDPWLKSIGAPSISEQREHGTTWAFVSQPLLDIHLDSHRNMEIEPNGQRSYLYTLSIIASFIIALACINFMNLATARAAKRAKEVGIRKVVGAARSRIAKQFMLESFVYCAAAILLSLALVSLTLTPFNVLIGKELGMGQLATSWFLSVIVLLFIVVSLLAGAYPAFYMTAFRPSEVLKGKLAALSRGVGVRNSLVIFQFMISTGLIVSTLIIFKQVGYMRAYDPGFDRENIVFLSNGYALDNKMQAFKNELKSHPEIVNATFSSRVPSQQYNLASNFRKFGSEDWYTLAYNWADADYAKVFGLKLLHGSFFSDSYPVDSILTPVPVVINKAAADLLGIENLGNKEYFQVGADSLEVVGIVDDFNFESLRTGVKPYVIYLTSSFRNSKAAIRLTPGDLPRKIELIKSIWSKYSSAAFTYTFLDENVEGQYKSEELFGKITIIFTGLALIIASIGLLGLVTYIAGQRTKEIGIRKVLGASVSQIVMLLSRDFVRLVIIAFAISLPIAWYFISRWLETFAYRIDFSIELALGAGLIVLAVALLTVSYQSMKAAIANPVKALRTE